MTHEPDGILATGNFLRLLRRDGWEVVERTNATGVVAVVAVTEDARLLLTEQFRPPVGCRVVDLPAGLVGDGNAPEEPEQAARRELSEEVGYEAVQWRFVMEAPSSPGMTTETIAYFRASELTKTGDGGGDESENIVVHAVPMADIDRWLEEQRGRGVAVDAKILVGMYLLSRER